jgi:hypothetical protein
MSIIQTDNRKTETIIVKNRANDMYLTTCDNLWITDISGVVGGGYTVISFFDFVARSVA